MFTATADLILPSTTTGSFPRPRWYDVGMWGRPLDTCMLDIRFREKFQDAMAVVISDQERAGLDILSHGDLHVDEDLAGRAWHHYPLQRWAGFEGDHLQPEETTAPWLHYPPGTLLKFIPAGVGRMSWKKSSTGHWIIRSCGGWRRRERASRHSRTI